MTKKRRFGEADGEDSDENDSLEEELRRNQRKLENIRVKKALEREKEEEEEEKQWEVI